MSTTHTEKSKGVSLAQQTRHDISTLLTEWEQRIIDYFSHDYEGTDWLGGRITRDSVERYLRMLHSHSVEVVRETTIWAPGSRIAEIGTAFGQNVLPLAKDLGFDVVALDLAENLDVYCRAMASESIALHSFDIYDPPSAIPGQPFDFLIFSEVLEHIFISVEAAVDRLLPFVRPGGRILLTTPNVYRDSNLLRMFGGYNLAERHPSETRKVNNVVVDGRVHPREYTLFEVAHAFQSHPEWELLKVWTCLSDGRQYDWRSSVKRLLLKTLFRFPMNDFIFAVAERKTH